MLKIGCVGPLCLLAFSVQRQKCCWSLSWAVRCVLFVCPLSTSDRLPRPPPVGLLSTSSACLPAVYLRLSVCCRLPLPVCPPSTSVCLSAACLLAVYLRLSVRLSARLSVRLSARPLPPPVCVVQATPCCAVSSASACLTSLR